VPAAVEEPRLLLATVNHSSLRLVPVAAAVQETTLPPAEMALVKTFRLPRALVTMEACLIASIFATAVAAVAAVAVPREVQVAMFTFFQASAK
jgi:hypothetical protein